MLFSKKKNDPFRDGCRFFTGTVLGSRAQVGRLLLLTDRGASEHWLGDVKESLVFAGFPVTECRYGGADALQEALETVRPSVLFVLGGGKLWQVTERLMTAYPAIHYAVMPTTFAGALRVPARGARLPDSFFFDGETLSTLTEEAYREGIAYAVRLGMTFDRWVFEAVYATVPHGEIVRRSVGIWHDIREAEDSHNSHARERYAFGTVLGRAIHTLSGGELTEGEALAIGMVLEAGVATRGGISRGRYFGDLVGMLTFRGLPTAFDVSVDSLIEALKKQEVSAKEVTLCLPVRCGECVPHTLTYDKLSVLLEN